MESIFRVKSRCHFSRETRIEHARLTFRASRKSRGHFFQKNSLGHARWTFRPKGHWLHTTLNGQHRWPFRKRMNLLNRFQFRHPIWNGASLPGSFAHCSHTFSFPSLGSLLPICLGYYDHNPFIHTFDSFSTTFTYCIYCNEIYCQTLGILT